MTPSSRMTTSRMFLVTLLYFLLLDADSKTECTLSQEDTQAILVAANMF